MIRGFQLKQKIHETRHSSIYRARRTADGCPVVLKMLHGEYPTPRGLAQYKHEYDIIRSLRAPGVIETYGLEKLGNTIAIVLEDFGGSSLSQCSEQQRPTIEQFLELAIQIIAALGQVHQQGVIHKDINPSNIIANPRTNQLKIIDFGIATRLSSESPGLKELDVLEGTWPYMSPEQTGRMNRRLDYRTDFYSFGVTLYELLTGQLPFDKTSALELAHCHIAAQPRPPIQIREDTPPVLSLIIMKLLAKTAEERYQSARGLAADLALCLEQVRAGQSALVFPLARQDAADRFAIPQKLYGRSREVTTLLDALERVSQGRSETVLVTGYSGIGKSSLIRELYKPITRKNAFFVSGKLDQNQRTTPYGTLSATLSELVTQLLTRSKDELLHWQNAFQTALGPNGRILTDLIPALELVIGPQPHVEQLGPLEVQNRLSLAFRNFIRVFCKPSHPLVLFLDDLQWVDTATLRLLEPMMADDGLSHFLLIGAYRDNEVDASHPLAMTLQSIEDKGVTVSEIHLQALRIEDIVQMLVDTLHHPSESVRAMAELVLRRTGGNPFFINIFLQTLHENGLLRFDASLPGWHWDMAGIEATPPTEHVAELMRPRLRRLPEEIQRLLRLAACLGHSFELDILALIAHRSLAETSSALMVAIEEGLVYPTSEPELMAEEGQEPELYLREHSFAHDRVQQAAYELIPADRRAAVHFDIGCTLLARLPAAAREERLFELVDHLNLGRSHLPTLSADHSQTRVELAGLNLKIGRQAKEAAAYAAAARYLEIGIELVGPAWEEHHELVLALHVDGALAEYCQGNFERSQALIDTALRYATSALVKARLYQTSILQYTNQGKHEDAFRVAREALSLLGHALPRAEELPDALTHELACVRQLLGDRPLESLVDAPEASDASCKAAIEILSGLAPAAYQSDRDMFDFITTRMVRLTLEHGHTVEGVYGYALHGASLGSRFTAYRRGYEFGALALRLADRFHSAGAKAKAGQVMFVFLYHWVKPLHGFLPISTGAFEASLQSGELQDACFNLMGRLLNYFHQGMRLERILDESSSFLQFARNNKNTVVANTIIAVQIAAAHLRGDGKRSDIIDMDSDAEYIAQCRKEASLLALGCYHLFKCQVLYLYRDYERALQAAMEAEKMRGYMGSLFSTAALTFYHSLCLTALFPQASSTQQQQSWRRLESLQAQMKIWMESCPRNFRHMYLLVAAEMARITGDAMTAVDLYADAIQAAEESEFLPDLALAHELAAQFWLGRGKTGYCAFHVRHAHYNYAAWGAERKLAMLEGQHGWLLGHPRQEGPPAGESRKATTRPRRSTVSISEHLDLASVLKASQAISSELVLDTLLAELMKIIIENAGAQRGYLLFVRDGELTIEAEGDAGSERYRALPSLGLGETRAELSHAAVRYVAHTGKSLVLSNASAQDPFAQEAYVRAHGARSLLCAPIARHGKLVGIVYLENNLTADAFTPVRVEVVQMLASQAAISIENARLLHSLRLSKEDAERAREEAERASRAKSEFLASVNHELRTPMNGIIGMIELLLGTGLDDEQSDYLATAQASAEQLMRIIRDTLDLSRIEAGKLELEPIPFSLDDCLGTLVRMLSPRAQAEGQTLAFDVAHDVPTHLVGDRDRLLQVLINLLSNAIKFTPAGGSVSVHVRVESRAAEQALLRFDVRDTGIGIAAEEQAAIFQPFTQARLSGARQGGSGLGLTIASRLVELMHGTILVESELGRGSCFSFTASFGLWQPAVLDGSPPASSTDPAGGLRILVAEDNPINQRVAVRLLAMDGHACAVAANGAEALHLLDDEHFDAVLMDVQMPIMDGLTATREIRRREQGSGRHLCIIAVTASATTEVVAECVASGMDHYLSKPLRIYAVRELLQRIQARAVT